MEMRRIKLSSFDSLHLERNYTLLRNHISIFFDLCRYFHIFVHTRRHSRVHRCNETRQMRRSDAERERERGRILLFHRGIKFRGSSVICLDPAAITDIIFAGIATELVTLVITLTKPPPYSWPRWSTRRQIKGLKRSTRHSLMNYFEWKLDWLRARNGA